MSDFRDPVTGPGDEPPDVIPRTGPPTAPVPQPASEQISPPATVSAEAEAVIPAPEEEISAGPPIEWAPEPVAPPPAEPSIEPVALPIMEAAAELSGEAMTPDSAQTAEAVEAAPLDEPTVETVLAPAPTIAFEPALESPGAPPSAMSEIPAPEPVTDRTTGQALEPTPEPEQQAHAEPQIELSVAPMIGPVLEALVESRASDPGQAQIEVPSSPPPATETTLAPTAEPAVETEPQVEFPAPPLDPVDAPATAAPSVPVAAAVGAAAAAPSILAAPPPEETAPAPVLPAEIPPPILVPPSSPRVVTAPARPRSAWPSRLRRALFILIGLAAGYAVLVVALIVAYRWIDPPRSALMITNHLTGQPVIYAPVPLTRISSYLQRAVVTSEDARFCSHQGVDWVALYEAMNESRGGSTITMQTAKNLFLWSSRSYVRKAIEIPVALTIDAFWSKRRILEVYLNIAEWGPGIFGAEAAAYYHFDKPASRLTAHEATLLAASLPNPIARDAGEPGRVTAILASRLRARMANSDYFVSCLGLRSMPRPEPRATPKAAPQKTVPKPAAKAGPELPSWKTTTEPAFNPWQN